MKGHVMNAKKEWYLCVPFEKIIDLLNAKYIELLNKSVSNSIWTVEFKRILQQIGIDEGFTVWGTGLDNSEWLYDVCWVKDGDKWMTHFKGLELICEMEWGESDFDHLNDFYKLCVGMANYRIFMFGYDNTYLGNEVYKEKIRLFKKASAFTKGQKFLVIGIPRPCNIDLPWEAWES